MVWEAKQFRTGETGLVNRMRHVSTLFLSLINDKETCYLDGAWLRKTGNVVEGESANVN